MLQDLVAQFGGERCFIVWNLTPGSPKPIKQPVDPYTGLASNAQDPATWMTGDEALAWLSTGTVTGIGVVLYPGCGRFCIDLDKALVNGEWTQLAREFFAKFPLAAKEISHSVVGGHIFGTCAKDFPEHRTRSKSCPGLEIYTRLRFVALTGTSLVGDLRHDYTRELQEVIAQYLPEAVGERDAQWTDGPYEGWRAQGVSDAQIIYGMRQRKGAAAVFGGGASFDDLWTGNTDALAHAFPDSTGANDYDRSAADQALANHLAYGTGYDCERTLALMLQSGLRREKWDREDYLVRTITRAVAGKRAEAEAKAAAAVQVATILEAPPPPAAPEAPPVGELAAPAVAVKVEAPEAPVGRTPGKFWQIDEQRQLFAGHTYVVDLHSMVLPDGRIVDQKQFNAMHGGQSFVTDFEGKMTTDAWEGYLESRLYDFPRAAGMVFRPELAPGSVVTIDGLPMFNSYVPLSIPMMEGDASPFVDHVRKLWPYGQDAEYLLAYLAFCVQHKGKKSPWWPLLQGVEGNGKSFFSLAMRACLGSRYVHDARAKDLDSNFNSHLYGKLLICIEDVYISESRNSVWEALKPMITNTHMEIEGKGVNKVTREVCFNGLMNSNHRNAVRKTPNDRRLCPMFGAQQTAADLQRDGLNSDYFKRLYGWFENGGAAIVAHFLQHYKIPDALNPAVDCIRPPTTTSTQAALVAGRGSVEQEIIEAIDSSAEGFRNGWLDSVAFDLLLKDMGRTRAIPRNQRIDLIQALGYVPHPGLPGGRSIKRRADSSCPTLYVKPDHPSMHLQGMAASEAYFADQSPQSPKR